MSAFRLVSRCTVPRAPRKYFVVTMVEAFRLQKTGNSTPRCSKTTSLVFQFCCTTSRTSQVTWSYGCTPAVVKTRLIFSPGDFRPPRVVAFAVSVMVRLPFDVSAVRGCLLYTSDAADE